MNFNFSHIYFVKSNATYKCLITSKIVHTNYIWYSCVYICFYTQLLPVLVIGLVLALHIFVRPYEKLRHNIIEAVILINYTVLFLLRGTQTFLDDLSDYTGNQVTILCSRVDLLLLAVYT